MSLPPGFRFCPTDDELIGYYLLKKDAGTLSPAEQNYIQECDLYGNREPWEIWEAYDGNSLVASKYLYFFTKLKKKSEKNSSRKVGLSGGNWDGKAKVKTFFVYSKERGALEAEKRTFNYRPNKKKSSDNKRKSSADKESGWMMVEYCVKSLKLEWVVCLLKRNNRSSGSSTDENQNFDGNKRRRVVATEKAVDVDPPAPAAAAANQMELEVAVSDYPGAVHFANPSTMAGGWIEDLDLVAHPDWDSHSPGYDIDLDLDDILNVLNDPDSDVINNGL